MAQRVTMVEREPDSFGPKETFRVHTDAGKVYVFERFPDSPKGARFVRRGEGDDARRDFTTNNYTLPGDVRRVANAIFGGAREPCGVERAPESAEPVGWYKD